MAASGPCRGPQPRPESRRHTDKPLTDEDRIISWITGARASQCVACTTPTTDPTSLGVAPCPSPRPSRVLVVGGGITGTVLSLGLAQRGVDVVLLEAREQLGGGGHGITLQGNALGAFHKVGVFDKIVSADSPSTCSACALPTGT